MQEPGRKRKQAAKRELLGKATLVTHQTGPQAASVVKRLLAEELRDIEREFYVGMVVDRGTGRLAMMASAEGGVEIEEVAARAPEKILRESIDPAVGLQGFQARKLAFGIGIPVGVGEQGRRVHDLRLLQARSSRATRLDGRRSTRWC